MFVVNCVPRSSPLSNFITCAASSTLGCKILNSLLPASIFSPDAPVIVSPPTLTCVLILLMSAADPGRAEEVTLCV